MKITERFYGVIPECELALNKNEVAQRLMTSREYTNELINRCEVDLRKHIDCKYSGIRAYAQYPCENTVNFGSFTVNSKSLYTNLNKSREVFIMAVTLGCSVDMLLKRLSVTSMSAHYITDGLASAFAEAAADMAESKIKCYTEVYPRFSVGYGDFDLCYQSNILDLVDAGKLLGIALSDSKLMTPQKSITAIMGIKNY